jgi:hypothetical protein
MEYNGWVGRAMSPICVNFSPFEVRKCRLYHENRIALVNNFVCLLPLKNIVQGRKEYLKVEKKIPWESFFPLFYPWAGKVKS